MPFPSNFGSSADDSYDFARHTGIPEATTGWHTNNPDRRKTPARYEAHVTAVVPTASPSTSALATTSRFPLTPVHRWVAARFGSAVDFHAWMIPTANPDLQAFHLALHCSSGAERDLRASGDHRVARLVNAALEDLDVLAIMVSRAVTQHPDHGITDQLVDRIGTIESVTAESILTEVSARVDEGSPDREWVAKVCAGAIVPRFERVRRLADMTERIEVGDLLPALAPDRANLEAALAEAAATAVARELMRAGEWDTAMPGATEQMAYATHMAASEVVRHTRSDISFQGLARAFHFAELNVCGRCYWCILNEQPAGPLTPETEARVLDEIYARNLDDHGSPEEITYSNGRFDTGGRAYCTTLAFKSLDQICQEPESGFATRGARITSAIASAVAAGRLTYNDLIHAEPLFEDLEHDALLAHRNAQKSRHVRGG
ncbi:MULTISPECIES: hypothetical protein [Demequina]|uniref:hypothetical protein n=1 Tax=Demequina TaxID=577469 RepID=UPI000784D6AF|nr:MULTISPECIES: hypothetical protein [Demequina]